MKKDGTKRLVPRPSKTIDALLAKGTVVDFRYGTNLLYLIRMDVEGSAAIKGYDLGVDLHPFKRYRG
jgi:hypothetical protein